MRNLLIIGAQKNSLGAALALAARQEGRWDITTAGISGQEDRKMDVRDPLTYPPLRSYHDVICTAGINQASKVGERMFGGGIRNLMENNAIGPIRVLEDWAFNWHEYSGQVQGLTFVMVSSNSAHIPRSQSAGYCMSKAALSIGVRCIARQLATPVSAFNIFGYEPGWIEGTPMSDEVNGRKGMEGLTPSHRIPGGRTLTKEGLAAKIIADMVSPIAYQLNGCMVRIDGGEL